MSHSNSPKAKMADWSLLLIGKRPAEVADNADLRAMVRR
jgi:hypothetical protein